MTAKLDIHWIERVWEQEAVASTLVRNITPPKPQLRCPQCNSIVYSRRHKLCGVCGEELPQDFLLTAMEASRVKDVLAAEKLRHRLWMNKAHWE